MRRRARCGFKMVGNKYILMQEYQKAIPIFEDIIKNSNDINDYFKYAFLLVMVGESEKAFQILQTNKCIGQEICKFLIDIVNLNRGVIKEKGDKLGLSVLDIILGKEG